MSPTIRIDDDVFDELKKHAEPLVDTPNTVLRRLLGLSGSVADSDYGASCEPECLSQAGFHCPWSTAPTSKKGHPPDASEDRNDPQRVGVRGPDARDHQRAWWPGGCARSAGRASRRGLNDQLTEVDRAEARLR